MKLLIKLIVSLMWGFATHQAAPAIAVLSPGLSRITSYGVGIMCALPVGVAVNREFGDIKDQDKRFIVTFLATFFSYGAGVALGYLVSTVAEHLHPTSKQ